MEDDVPLHLAQNIRQLRETRGFTQERMAKLSGVPRPT
ncbi:MAG: helix-turn-helix transcriptional regulator, partial [Myxococcales bacterium]|nr:helix-turn-helix transcriptional regulator [Myxococcales bacterium]